MGCDEDGVKRDATGCRLARTKMTVDEKLVQPVRQVRQARRMMDDGSLSRWRWRGANEEG